MQVALIRKKHILKDFLPKNIIDKYWIVDKSLEKDNKLISIEFSGSDYVFTNSAYSELIDYADISISNNSLEYSGNSAYASETILEANHSYPVFLKKSKEVCMLYCMPDYDNSFTHVDINTTSEITVGSDSKNTIVYSAPFVNKIHAKIVKEKNKWTVINNDSAFGVYVNDFPVYSNKKNLFNGDVLFIMGLKIIVMGNSMYINSPNNSVSLNPEALMISKIRNSELKNEDINKKLQILTEKNSINYYSKAPRMLPPIKVEKIKIDSPPEVADDNHRPMFLALASSLAMGIMMISSLTSSIQGIVRGTASTFESVIGLVSSLAMLIAMIVIPIIEIKWDSKTSKDYEKKRQKRYTLYLSNKYRRIESIKKKQKQYLMQNYLSSAECLKVISGNSPRLWERNIYDSDFLSVRIGLGNVPLQINLEYPQEKFAMVDDNLVSALNSLANNSKNIPEAPVCLSLAENTISAIVSSDLDYSLKYMKNIILQLITLHSYADLKLVFLVDDKTSREWQYVKMLPHVWDNSNQTRFFADNIDDMNSVSQFLVEEIQNRSSEENKGADYLSFSPYYLIITDNYKKVESLGIFSELAKSKINYGFSLLCLSEDVYSLPSSCKVFMSINENGKGVLYNNNPNSNQMTEIKIDSLVTVYFEKVTQKLANLQVKTKKGATSLPSSYTFLEMFDVGKIEQLEVLRRWQKNDSTLSLKAPIGVDSNGMIIYLDAHEKFHGPHGLIAGSTGSGKSEFIITYILSLAINYHPNDVTFLLIDYKGGGLAGAFEKHDVKLPHLVGTITNIDKNGLERSLTSIQSELRRRQVAFNEARNMTNEGTIDIYKYQKLFHDGIVKKPIPHLFIICDEFAELKQQQPEFMDELVSVSRIGRSLGVHLILATQKPSGIVDDQIRSNSKFAVCLKVQDAADSHDLLNVSDAAYLKNPGQFYLKVGQNEFFVLGQSGWAGAQYIPSDVPIKNIDTSVEFISNTGLPIKKLDENFQPTHVSETEQLTSILKYIDNVADTNNISTTKLWLDSIPTDIYVNDLRKKYNPKFDNGVVDIIVGEYDDPSNQKQGLVEFNLNKGDNIIIYGNAKSGKESFLSTFAYDLMNNYSVDQAQLYILDFGTEALKIFTKSPHVGDVVFVGQDEKLDTFFDMLQTIIRERKQILSDYNGDYNLYLSKGNVMPTIVVMINNYEVFSENYEDKYDDLVLTLTRDGAKCGIIFVVTASTTSAMRYRLTSNFNKKIGLQLNDEDDYYSIFDSVGGKRPSHTFGRGLVSIGGEVFEFQTAKVCENNAYNQFITETIQELSQKYPNTATPIPTLPAVLSLDIVQSHLTGISNVPLGLVKKNLSVYSYDFKKNFMTVISSKSIELSTEFSSYLFEELDSLENVKTLVLDGGNSSNLKKSYNEFVKEIKNNLKSKDDTFYVYEIIGISNFSDESVIDEYKFSDLLSKIKESGNSCFILVENPDKLEEHTYDDWYTNYIDQNSGIWIGNGMDSQTLITTNFSMENLDNNCGSTFGYVVDQGIPTLVKYIGIEEGDN